MGMTSLPFVGSFSLELAAPVVVFHERPHGIVGNCRLSVNKPALRGMPTAEIEIVGAIRVAEFAI